jgi:hypothetical protein
VQVPALRATLDDEILVALDPRRYRFHQATAIRCPVARTDVDVLRIEAVRAMICVAVTSHVPPAVLAGEVLYRPGEPPPGVVR